MITLASPRIVEEAVGMVEFALQRLEAQGVVDLDEERKAAMVSNLLVVPCSDHATQPSSTRLPRGRPPRNQRMGD
jgi:hypothetical protein